MSRGPIEYDDETLRDRLASPKASETAKGLLDAASKGGPIVIRMKSGEILNVEGFLATLFMLKERFGWSDILYLPMTIGVQA